MANVSFVVSNPTGADITVNAKTALAGHATALLFDDAALIGGWNDLVTFLASGCSVARASIDHSIRSRSARILARQGQRRVDYPLSQ